MHSKTWVGRILEKISGETWLKLVFECCLKYDVRVSAVYSPGVTDILADALSRFTVGTLYEQRFLKNLITYFLALPYHILLFSAIRIRQLEPELKRLRSCALANSSLQTHNYQWESFKEFCKLVGRKFLPASVITVCLLIARLARNLQYTTILTYVNHCFLTSL